MWLEPTEAAPTPTGPIIAMVTALCGAVLALCTLAVAVIRRLFPHATPLRRSTDMDAIKTSVAALRVDVNELQTRLDLVETQRLADRTATHDLIEAAAAPIAADVSLLRRENRGHFDELRRWQRENDQAVEVQLRDLSREQTRSHSELMARVSDAAAAQTAELLRHMRETAVKS